MTKISAVIPDDVATMLKERARIEDRSVGAVIRRAVAEHVGHVALRRSALGVQADELQGGAGWSSIGHCP